MQGLLDVYTRTHNKKAYDMVKGMADYVCNRMSKLDAATIDKMMVTTKANPQNEMGAMNEVLYKLYQLTSDPKHLALAKMFDPDWFSAPLAESKDILSGLHSNTQSSYGLGIILDQEESVAHDKVAQFRSVRHYLFNKNETTI